MKTFLSHTNRSHLGLQHLFLTQGFSVMFWGPKSRHSTLEKQFCICFVNCIIPTTSGEKNPRPTVPRASGIGISRRIKKKKKGVLIQFALHIVVSLSNLPENFPLAFGSFSNWSAVFQRLLCMRKDKELFIKQNGGRPWLLGRADERSGLHVLAPPCTSLLSLLQAPPPPNGGGRTVWAPSLKLKGEHYCKLSSN